MKRSVIAVLFVAMAGLMFATASHARIRYVATDGKTTNSGATPDSAWTIDKAFQYAVSGDTVYIKGGKYVDPNLIVSNNGSAQYPIVFEGYDGLPILDGVDWNNTRTGKNPGNATTTNFGIYLSGKSYVTLRNIKVKNYFAGIWLTGSCSYCTLDGCVADSCSNTSVGSDGYGFTVQLSDHITVKNCSATGNNGDNYLFDRVENCLIQGCGAYSTSVSNDPFITDYYMIIAWSSNNTFRDCICEDINGSYKGNHGFMNKDSYQYEYTHSTGNKFINCTAKKLEEGFSFAHGPHHNTVDSCYADNTGKGSVFNFCFMVRDGAHDNVFKNCTGIGTTGCAGVYDGFNEGSTTNQVQYNNTFQNCLFRGGDMSVFMRSAVNTTFTNCTFANSTYMFRFEKSYNSADSTRGTTLKNCIVSGIPNPHDTRTLPSANGWTSDAPYNDIGDVSATYTDFWDNGFSAFLGDGNISEDPLYASGTDFHLKSQAGRWENGSLVYDNETSPCIDAGNRFDDCSNEPQPNGDRIDMGRYGNAKDASLSGLGVIKYVAADGSTPADYHCDGTSDEVEINAALAYVDTSTQYTTVFLIGPATYTITNPLLLGERTTLTGDSTVVVKIAAGSAQTSAIGVLRSGLKGIKIAGFEIDGNRANNTTGCTLCTIDNVQGLEISGMKLHDVTSEIANIRDCDSVFVYNNVLGGAGNDGVIAYRSRNVWMHDNTVEARTGAGLKSSSSDAVKIYGNTVYGTGEPAAAGIRVERTAGSESWPVTSVEVYNNVVHGIDQSGIDVSSATHAVTDSVHIHHNIVYDCASSAGAGIRSCAFTVFCENNTVDGCAKGSFAVAPGTDTVSGFTVRLRNNIFSNSPADTAVANLRSTTESVYLENNCLFNAALGCNAAAGDTGTITGDPLFANPAEHNYRLKSVGGRWNGTRWVIDTVTSPCIDAGYVGSDYSNESAPNGSRINIGVFGNTTEASRTRTDGPIVYVSTTSGDGMFKCDGTRDDIEINLALAFADTSERYNMVYLKGPATYSVDGTLFLGSDVSLLGDSSAVVYVVNGSSLASGSSIINTLGAQVDVIRISGFEIDGNRANNAAKNYALCLIDSAKNVEISDMNIHDGPGDLVRVVYTDSVSIRANILSLPGANCVFDSCCTHVSILDNTVTARIGAGLKVSASDTVKIAGNIVCGTDEAETTGIQVYRPNGTAAYPVKSVEITGNTVYNMDQTGIELFSKNQAKTDSVHVHHNTVYRCSSAGGAYVGISSYGLQLLCENNVVDSCTSGGFTNPKGLDTMGGFVIRLRNNIFSNSPADTAVVLRRSGTESLYLENNCLFNVARNYNTVTSATNNITSDPCFADPASHDYHLKSQEGRYFDGSWVKDAMTSLCIDAGYAGSDCSLEPEPNGSQINIGRYGNTTEASKHYTAVEIETPLVFSLSQNVPNPFNPSTTITYSIGDKCMVKLVVYNIAGQKIATLVNTTQAPGVHTIRWQPEHLASGIYFCRLQAGSFSKTTKLVFMK